MNDEFPLNAHDWEVLAIKAIYDGAKKAISCYDNAARLATMPAEQERLKRTADEMRIISNT